MVYQIYRFSQSDAERLHAAARNSVATFPKNDSTKLLIVQAVDSLNAVYDALYILRGEMLRLASLLPEFDVVMAMQGAGEITGPQLMAEIGDVRRFTHKGALVAFAGMDVLPFQSGTLFMSSCSYSSGGKDAGGSSEIGGLGVTMIISGGWVTTITSGGVFSALICS